MSGTRKGRLAYYCSHLWLTGYCLTGLQWKVDTQLVGGLRVLTGLRPLDARTMWTRLKLLGDWIPVPLNQK